MTLFHYIEKYIDLSIASIIYMKTLRPTYINQNKAIQLTNLNNSFSMENEKRAAQVGLEPTTY